MCHFVVGGMLILDKLHNYACVNYVFANIVLPHLHFLWFQGVYVNIDEFKSKFRVLSAKFGKPGQPVRHVFNYDLL